MDADREHDGPTRGSRSRVAHDRRGARRRRERLHRWVVPGRKRTGVGVGRAVRRRHRFVDGDGGHAPPTPFRRRRFSRTARCSSPAAAWVAMARHRGRARTTPGNGSAVAELLRPDDRGVDPTAPLDQRRELQIAVALPDGRVLVAGGSDCRTWHFVRQMLQTRGANGQGDLDAARELDPGSDVSWLASSSLGAASPVGSPSAPAPAAAARWTTAGHAEQARRARHRRPRRSHPPSRTRG